jgi:TonB family protein
VWVTYRVEFDLDGSTKSGEDLSLGDADPSLYDFIAVEKNPEMTFEQPPVYPQEAKDEGLNGVVWVKAYVHEDGAVAKAIVGKTSGHKSLDKAALEAAYKCRYTPALAEGKPIATWVTYKVDFNLAKK